MYDENLVENVSQYLAISFFVAGYNFYGLYFVVSICLISLVFLVDAKQVLKLLEMGLKYVKIFHRVIEEFLND